MPWKDPEVRRAKRAIYMREKYRPHIKKEKESGIVHDPSKGKRKISKKEEEMKEIKIVKPILKKKEKINVAFKPPAVNNYSWERRLLIESLVDDDLYSKLTKRGQLQRMTTVQIEEALALWTEYTKKKQALFKEQVQCIIYKPLKE